jgi:uncharacterized damage-inducible protein DinB
LILTLALAGAMAQPALADHDHDHAAKAGGGAAVKAEVLRQIDDAEEKLVALAEATPADKLAWRPAEKVRSTGEVFLHVAGGNYYLAGLAGIKTPEGINMKEIENGGTDKAKVIETMKKSFDHVRKAIQATTDADMDKAVKVFDHEGTVREIFMIIATHAHEHLGQSIAYARSNGITPPWSS